MDVDRQLGGLVLAHLNLTSTGCPGLNCAFGNLASTWDEFSLEIDDIVASGDRVCAIGRAGGTLDGGPASYGFVHAWVVRDGVCVRFDEYVNPDELIAHAAA